jgi:DsbC/DsbD-like thiol-disulfide interchange protein
MLKALVAVLALCAAAAQQAPAQLAGVVQETKHLTVITSASPDAVAPGKRVSLAVDVAPKPKMHVYAPGQEGYIAITLTLDPDPAFTASKAKYPAGEKILIKILNETQLVYAKPFRIAQDLTIRPAVKGSSMTIKGTLRYQACDDTICYVPTNVPVSWTVKLARGI